jgi:hypothetical protein
MDLLRFILCDTAGGFAYIQPPDHEIPWQQGLIVCVVWAYKFAEPEELPEINTKIPLKGTFA